MKWLQWYTYGAKYVLRTKVSKKLTGKKRKASYEVPYLNPNEANQWLIDKIQEGKPFMVARVGFNEMSMMKAYDFKKKDKYAVCTKIMCDMAGFFPNETSLGNRFLEEMKQALGAVDILALMDTPFEDYYVNTYLQKYAVVTPFSVMDFWSFDEPWTRALAGKKVLVVHPFAKSIEQQYQKKKEIFRGKDILPDFDLQTYKAIQTAGGGVDDRFATWFDALDFMIEEVTNLDFDIAIVGCGAYGFPLAAAIKNAGKSVIHMGGVSQILFGIKGQRWTKEGSSLLPFINDAWVWPLDEEVPVDPERIEGGPYFRPTESYMRRIRESEKKNY